jgi:hypothetical protein
MIEVKDKTYDLPANAEELEEKCLSQANKAGHPEPEGYCIGMSKACEKGVLKPYTIKECYDQFFVSDEAFSNPSNQDNSNLFSSLDNPEQTERSTSTFGGLPSQSQPQNGTGSNFRNGPNFTNSDNNLTSESRINEQGGKQPESNSSPNTSMADNIKPSLGTNAAQSSESSSGCKPMPVAVSC